MDSGATSLVWTWCKKASVEVFSFVEFDASVACWICDSSCIVWFCFLANTVSCNKIASLLLLFQELDSRCSSCMFIADNVTLKSVAIIDRDIVSIEDQRAAPLEFLDVPPGPLDASRIHL